MLKILLIANNEDIIDQRLQQWCDAGAARIVAKVAPGLAAVAALEKYKPDIVVNSISTSKLLNEALEKSATQRRLSVMASTHQGIQLVPVQEVYYFQADDKYVTAHHKKGELLIEDSLTDLEQEFGDDFVRIHRKILVSIAKIEGLHRTEDGKHFVNIHGLTVKLPVSRRQLPKLRKVLLWK